MNKCLANFLNNCSSIYISICTILYFFQEKLIFFPQKLEKTYQFQFEKNLEDKDIKMEFVTIVGEKLQRLLQA